MMSPFHYSHKRQPVFEIAIIIAALLAWSSGIGLIVHFTNRAGAAMLNSFSDTLSDSDLNVPSNHTIVFNTPTGVSSTQTMVVSWPTGNTEFSSGSIKALIEDDVDVLFNGTQASTTNACSGDFALAFSTSSDSASSSITFTLCSGFNVNSNASTTIRVGTNATAFGTGVNRITNPNPGAPPQSYEIKVRGSMADSGDTRVAIIDDVVVTASVDTSLTFTIAGVATGTTINGATTTYSTAGSATTLPFGLLPLGIPITLGQELRVATNAKNGFAVTVAEDQNLQTSGGGDIDLFVDGNATATPSAWVSPSNSVSNEATWGHFGLTSDDDLNGGEFVTSSFVGNFQSSSPRQVFTHNGPSDATTTDIGMARVAYRIQITGLQEAGDDYTNTLTYVVTPTF